MSAKTEEDVERRVETFLKVQFPQIAMHGGDAIVEDLDLEEGSVTVILTDACSGCGISPMTIQALKQRMPKEIEEIEHVNAETGEDDRPGITEGPF